MSTRILQFRRDRCAEERAVIDTFATRELTAEELSQADGLLGGPVSTVDNGPDTSEWTEAQRAALLVQKPRGESAGAFVDVILRTKIAGRLAPPATTRLYAAERSKAVRDVFRALGWAKYFRVTKGGYTLGTSIELAKEYRSRGAWRLWECAGQAQRREEANRAPLYVPVPVCGCVTCKYREAQREALMRRVHYVLNLAFRVPGEREFGDRSDSQSDYFDADYTFHP